MKTFFQYLREETEFDIHNVDYDKNYGKSFRWAYTPEGQGVPGSFSLVTPENGDAWKNWKPVSDEHHKMLRDKWHEQKEAGTLVTFVAPYKIDQIEKHAI